MADSSPIREAAILWIDDLAARDAPRAGGKAANLAELRRIGLQVPNGFVVVDQAGGDLDRALDRLGPGPYAVRSSAVAEDLAEASFAGQYETYLDVDGHQSVREAIERCRAAAASSRVASYREQRGVVADSAIAVLVQLMVPTAAAGVAFTANPVTGDRAEVVVSAVRGLGERLVAGSSTAEEWIVRSRNAARKRGNEPVITREQAASIADLAHKAAEHFGRPQDVEWAVSNQGKIFLLQSRPMTALPASIKWTAPGPGYWMRNLRLGEWLPEPVTPLFEDWLMPLLNAGFARGNGIDVGLGAGLRQAVVNGWYYSTPQPDLRLRSALRAIALRPGTLLRFATALLKQSTEPAISERRYFASVVRRWREDALPRYRKLVEAREREVDGAPIGSLFGIVDELGKAAGEQVWCLAIGGGSAWKIEVALARFYHAHLATKVSLDVATLLAGLPVPVDHSAPYLVESADWYRATMGERGVPAPAEVNPRREGLAEKRIDAENTCRDALAGQTKLQAQFEELLGLAQSYARLREEQAFQLTLAWPVLRRCVIRLGAEAARLGLIEVPNDAFFLTSGELTAVIANGEQPDLRKLVAARRSDWDRERRLVPPLSLGNAPKLLQRMLGSLELLRSDSTPGKEALRGEPASPGRASGRVRVIRGPDDFASFQQGEILVSQATAPAWTPLFARAAGVVTDGGSLAAHASLVAREYGIPAVVATGNATERLVDGQWVTVDGSGGFVEVES